MKVSIITVCKNAQDTIEQTIKSVISQTYNNIEYLIIDGKSTDNTLAIVNKYKNMVTAVISEKDEGLYYAMNKGIDLSTGDIIYFLNSGDILFDKNIISHIVKIFNENETDFVFGDIAFYNSDKPNRLILGCQNNVSNFFLAHATISHQTIFAKKNVFVKYGKFDTQYRLQADYEWILRSIIKNKVPYYYTKLTIVKYLREGFSVNNGEIQGLKERLKILPLYFNITQILFNGLLLWFLYRMVKKIKRDWFSKG